MQVPAAHSEPRSQAVPLQHGWPRAPQAGGAWHVPAVHCRPAAQSVPQHAWPSAPHVAQPASTHVPPLAQTPPAQHRPPTLPHWVSRTQSPSSHTPPLQQSFDVSQSPPVSTQHRPPLQP